MTTTPNEQHAPQSAQISEAAASPRKRTLRGAPITVGFMLLIVGIELVLSISDSFWTPDALREEAFLQFAPFFWGAELRAEPYTLATTALLHGSLLHVGINAALIAALGPQIERAIGPLVYIGLLLALAVATPLGHWAMLSLKGGDPHWSVLVGASGVVSGFIAIDIVARAEAIRRAPPEMRAHLPAPATLILRVSTVMILVNLGLELLGASLEGAQISGAGHISGYLAGLLLAPFLVRYATRRVRS